MQLQAAGSCPHLFDKRFGGAGVSLSEKSEVHRPRVGGLQHPRQVPRPGRASGGGGSRSGPRAAADHGGDAVRKRLIDLLRRNEMDVAVDAARGHDHVLARDHLGRGPDHQFRIDALHRIRVSSLAHFDDASVANSDVGLHDAPMIDDERVGDHQIQGALSAGRSRTLPHAVANDLAASESDLVAISREVLLDFNDQFGIGQPHAIASGRSKQVRVGFPGNREAHLLPLPW